MSADRKIRCSWDGCWRTSTQPYTDSWAELFAWGPPVKDGFYCGPHADAIEQVFGSTDFDGLEPKAS